MVIQRPPLVDSTAANLLYQLHVKAKEKIADGSSTPDAALHDETPELGCKVEPLKE
jgi:hypothetical protein